MIVVAGGSGTLGRLVVAELSKDGAEVRVLVRDADRAREVLPSQVDVRVTDVRDRDAVTTSVADADVVISAMHGFLGSRGASPAEIDNVGNAHLIAAAAAAGAHMVLMSTVGAAPDSPLELFRAKYAAEQQLWASGVRGTVVRATAFLETWIGILDQTAARGGRPLVFGRGEQPIAFVSARDVAAVIAHAVGNEDLHARTLELRGPESMTMNQLARHVQDAAGRKDGARHLPRALLRSLAVLAKPVSPSFSRQNRSALIMDTTDLTFGARPISEVVPGATPTAAALVL